MKFIIIIFYYTNLKINLKIIILNHIIATKELKILILILMIKIFIIIMKMKKMNIFMNKVILI